MNLLYEKRNKSFDVMCGCMLSSVRHLHNEIEIIYVKTGKVTAFSDRKSYKLTAGDIFVNFSNQVHYYEECEKGDYWIYIFSPELVYGLKGVIDGKCPESNIIEKDMLDELHKLLLLALDSYKAEKYMASCGYINLFMSALLSGTKLVPAPQTNNASIRSIIEYCNSNFGEKITLDSVSGNLHMSKYYISHLLNDRLGFSFNDFINSLRIESACKKLSETDEKIADISEDVGYGTIRSFNRAFKSITGVTPGDYRKIFQETDLM